MRAGSSSTRGEPAHQGVLRRSDNVDLEYASALGAQADGSMLRTAEVGASGEVDVEELPAAQLEVDTVKARARHWANRANQTFTPWKGQ